MGDVYGEKELTISGVVEHGIGYVRREDAKG